MINAVAFDLWETLITDTPELSRLQQRVRIDAIAGLTSIEAARIETAHRDVWHRCQELYWSADRDISCRTQVEHLLELLEMQDVDPKLVDAVEDAYANAILEAPPAIVEGADTVLQHFKREGFLVGVISNTGRTPGSALRRVLSDSGLGSSIDAMVFSNEHGVCKPDRSIFEALREALGVAFEEMVFVGDNLYVDVHGAQRCGMRGVQFKPQRRGTAVAPPVEHGLTIVPDGVAERLVDVIRIVEGLVRDEG